MDNEYTNPIIWEDLPDLDVIRVNEIYYYSASTFSFSPGAPILRSYDLVRWEYIGHSVPRLDFGDSYFLSGSNSGAYVCGIWASTIGYRPSNGTFYWYGAIQGTGKTFVYTAQQPEGPWMAEKQIAHFYYDAGLFIDDDDTMYIAYGSGKISIAKLASDGFSEIENKVRVVNVLIECGH